MIPIPVFLVSLFFQSVSPSSAHLTRVDGLAISVVIVVVDRGVNLAVSMSSVFLIKLRLIGIQLLRSFLKSLTSFKVINVIK